MPLQGHRPILLRQTPVNILHHILTRLHPLTQKMPGQDKDAVCLFQIPSVLSVLPVPASMVLIVFSLMISLFFGCSPGVYGVNQP